jgi:hypothetical protein
VWWKHFRDMLAHFFVLLCVFVVSSIFSETRGVDEGRAGASLDPGVP